MKIRDLVAIDERAEFRNDVQLSDYDKKDVNLALVQSYLFTLNAPPPQDSSIGLLKTISDAFLNARLENRVAVVANYGHGKSHLALILANYFGKPKESTEFNAILTKLSNSMGGQANVSRFREFRENHPEFLVIRLRGDVPRNLRGQFFSALERGLKEHAATSEEKIPSWYESAESFLDRLSGHELVKANQFLEPLGTEVAVLNQDVHERDDTAYEKCRDLSTHLYGAPLDFGQETSIAELIAWAGNRFCANGGPLGGILILFDEFSLYVQSYAERSAAGELQDLLNGVEDQRGRAVFVALGQHDPVMWARTVARTLIGRESLEKELTRIPKKISLYSLMESVIDSYLSQPKASWEEFSASLKVKGPLTRASELTLELFAKRYEQTLRWSTSEFDRVVTKGCFPLHPLTTALLCDLKLQAMRTAGNPRTVLGFVLEQVRKLADEEAFVDGSKVNWVFPYMLVEYFQEYMPEGAVSLYENALRNLGPDAAPEQFALLKALLLQEAGRLQPKDRQPEFLAEAAGMRLDQARKALQELTDRAVVRYEPTTRFYSFWPVSDKPHVLRDLVEQRMEKLEFTKGLLAGLKESLRPMAVNVSWGHPEDWQATQHVLTREFLTVKSMRETISPITISPEGDMEDQPRGCVLWLLGLAEDDLVWYRQNAARIMNEAFPGNNPPPCIMILPAKQVPSLVDALKRKRILEDLGQDERQDIGISTFEHEQRETRKAILDGLASLRGDNTNFGALPRDSRSWVVPAAYQASLQATAPRSLQQILESCYRLAYRYAPPEFFTQYRSVGKGANRIGEAVRSLSAALVSNSLSSNSATINSNPLSRDLCAKFLVNGWKLAATDLRIQEPGDVKVLQGWRILDERCCVGASDVSFRRTIVDLFNPPFGYDANTATLLFCGWVGYNMHELQLSIDGRYERIDKLAMFLSAGGGRKFIQQMVAATVGLTRRDKAELARQVHEIIGRATRDVLTQDEASMIVGKLQTASDSGVLGAPEAESASQAAESLCEDLALAEDYDAKVEAISDVISQERSVDVLAAQDTKIANLPRLGRVSPTGPAPEALRGRLLARIGERVEEECRLLEEIQRVSQIDRNRDLLQQLSTCLKRAKLTENARRVDCAINKLSDRTKELETSEKEAPIRAEMEAMGTHVDLKTLHVSRTRLLEIQGCAHAAMDLRNDRLKSINAEIAQLETFARGLTAAAQRLDNVPGYDDWHVRYLRSYDRYLGSPLQAELDVAAENANKLHSFLSTLEAVGAQKPENMQEANEKIRSLDLLTDDFQAVLGDQQRLAIESVRDRILGHIEEGLSAARVRISSLEAQLERGGTLSQIWESIDLTPAFMTDAEEGQWWAIKNRVQARVEEDEIVQIERKFRSISGRGKRRECLERLQRILATEERGE